MSLDLDNRQLAMLREMGIRLWQAPSADAAAPEATSAAPARVEAQRLPQSSPVVAPSAAAPAPAPAARTSQNTGASASAAPATEEVERQTGPAWQLGSPQSIYPAEASPAPGTAIRWLLLAEFPHGATQPLEGEAGQLLDNMLRAAGMHRDASLKFVTVQRGRGAEPGSEGTELADQLALLVDAEQASVVMVMGRLAAQALLPSPEPFAKRRGQALVLNGRPLLLCNDAAYLLRNLPEKAKAWEDLCLARTMAVQATAQ